MLLVKLLLRLVSPGSEVVPEHVIRVRGELRGGGLHSSEISIAEHKLVILVLLRKMVMRGLVQVGPYREMLEMVMQAVNGTSDRLRSGIGTKGFMAVHHSKSDRQRRRRSLFSSNTRAPLRRKTSATDG